MLQDKFTVPGLVTVVVVGMASGVLAILAIILGKVAGYVPNAHRLRKTLDQLRARHNDELGAAKSSSAT